MPRPLRIFLCHSSNDKPTVRELYQKLRAESWIEPWLDEEELYPGQDWNMEIEKAVEAADAIIVCLTKNSINKEGYVQRELRTVLDFADYKPEGTLYIVPVRLEECEPPRRLRAWQYADYFEGQRERAFQRLLVSLKRRADGLGLMAAEVELKKIEEQAKREAAEKAAREKLELDAIEKTNREKEEQEAVENAREAKKKIARQRTPKPKIKKPEEQIVSAPVAEELKEEPKEGVSAKPFTKLLDASSLSSNVKSPQQSGKQSVKKSVQDNNLRWLSIGGIILLVLIFGGFGMNYFVNNLHVATVRPSPTKTVTSKPHTFTSESFTPTSQPTKTSLPTPTLGIGSTMIGEKGETLVYVKGGDFDMGNGDSDAPVHTVYLADFWIDQTEVTNKQYQACVDAGTCELPSNTRSYRHESYYGNPQFDNYPVIYVNWDKANRYCEVWVGGDLPTEAQWEKAARGTGKHTYPWGEKDITCYIANYQNSCVGDTSPVGSYKNGKSPYDAWDMAGNVWEWMNDWYSDTYYESSPFGNPSGPDSGKERVLRGGAWGFVNYSSRSADRNKSNQATTNDNIGFRCVRSP